MIRHQTACLMWEHDHDLLPMCFSNYFQKVNEIHTYNTRMSKADKLSVCYPIRTETHGKKMLKFYGPRLLNDLKDLSFYNKAKCKKDFLNYHKRFLLDKY